MRTVRKSEHNAYEILYHFVTPVKYRKALFGVSDRSHTLLSVCKEIEERFEIIFDQVGIDANHVHFLLSAAPKFSPSKIIQIVKSITARELFRKYPDLKKELWGGEFWSDGFYVATVSEHGNKDVIRGYLRKQGHSFDPHQLKLFNF
jgi:REP element-mobilizing transposase RayT